MMGLAILLGILSGVALERSYKKKSWLDGVLGVELFLAACLVIYQLS